MSIKQSITLFFLMMGVSFSAFINKVYAEEAQPQLYVLWSKVDPKTCGAPGMVVSIDFFVGCSSELGTITQVQFDGMRFKVPYIVVFTGDYASSCPEGQEYNSSSKSCQTPINCADHEGAVKHGQSWDYFALGSNPYFCSQSCEAKAINKVCATDLGSCTGDIVVTGESCTGETQPGGTIPDPLPNGCARDGNTYSCPKDTDGDGYPDAGAPIDDDAECTYDIDGKFSCSGGSYNPPEYEPTDPTTPIEPTDPSRPIGAPPSDPINTNPIAPVEPVNPVEGTDTAVLNAIQAQNADMNKALNALNSDNNQNFADLNTQLAQLDLNTVSINENAISQLAQDLEIYEQNKALSQQQTTDIVHAIERVGEFDELYNNQLKAKIGEASLEQQQHLTSELSKLDSSLTEQLGSLETAVSLGSESTNLAISSLEGAVTQGTSDTVAAIDALSDKLGNGETCVPTADNKYCENYHGTTDLYVSEVFNDMSDSTELSIQGVEETILTEVETAITTPMTGEVESVIQTQINKVLDILPDYGECQPLALPSPFGGYVYIPCTFSEKFKLLFSFVLYFFTVNSIINVLLEGVTARGTATVKQS